jgi:CubicO group peptidase (beta-lactamase class C family)
MLLAAILALTVSLFSLSCGGPPETAPLEQGDWDGLVRVLTSRIEYEMDAAEVVGLSIAIVEPEGVRWSSGFGLADREAKRPATDRTIYRVGSMSKPFTAALVMTLVETGRLDLDAPLETYLASFSIRSRFENAGPVTLRSILTQRSGLPFVWRKIGPNGLPIRYDRLVHEMSDASLVHPPGLAYKYSNLGFNLAGHAAQSVAGRSFVELGDALLRTIGAETATFAPTEGTKRLLARPYQRGRLVEDFPELGGEIPSGGLHASVLDYARFTRLFLGDGQVDGARPLSEQSVAEMLAVEPPSPLDFGFLWGLGWNRTAPKGLDYAGEFASHGGQTFVYSSGAVLSLDHEVGVVVCANTEESIEAVDRILRVAMRLALEVKGIREPSGRETPAPFKPAASRNALEGRYQTRDGIFDVASGDHIEARGLGDRVRLVDEGGNWFSPRYLLLGSIPLDVGGMGDLRFAFADVARRTVVVYEENGLRMRVGDRIEPSSIHPAWRKRLGAYDLADEKLARILYGSSPNVVLAIDGEYLVLTYHRIGEPAGNWAVRTLSEDEAVFEGLIDYLGGETLRAIRVSGRERLLFSGYEFERVGD